MPHLKNNSYKGATTSDLRSLVARGNLTDRQISMMIEVLSARRTKRAAKLRATLELLLERSNTSTSKKHAPRGRSKSSERDSEILNIDQGSSQVLTTSGNKQKTTSSDTDSDVWLAEDDHRVQFATGQVAELRKELLEGIGRGNILDMKHGVNSRSQIRVVDGSLDEIYAHLVAGGLKCSFKGLEDPPENPKDESGRNFERTLELAFETDETYLTAIDELDEEDDADQIKFARAERALRDIVRDTLGLPPRLTKGVDSVADIARSQGINPSFDLRRHASRETSRTKVLQTLDFQRELSLRMSGLRKNAVSAIQETGNNSLHSVFGFLEWYPEKRPDRRYLSPLVLASVGFDEATWKARRQLVVSGQSDESLANPVLQIRLLNDEHISLPKFDAEGKISDYLDSVENLVKDRPRWKVRRFLTFGSFESALIEIWKDLDPDNWPENQAPARHKSVATLLAGGSDRSDYTGGDYDLDSPEISERLSEPILKADSSQLSAILDVLDGHDIAIEGPPGTGKSQTIANMIAALIQKGKTVLFVAEKMAALDVVKDRLNNVGLGNYVLELHSTKSRRANVYNSFSSRQRAYTSNQTIAQYRDQLSRLQNLKHQLNAYVDEMNSVMGSTGSQVHSALWKIQNLQPSSLSLSLKAMRVDDVLSIDTITREAIIEDLALYEQLEMESISEFGGLEDHPWNWVTKELSQIERERLALEFESTKSILGRFREVIEQLSWSGFDNPEQKSFEHVHAALTEILKLPDEIESSWGDFFSRITPDITTQSLKEVADAITETAKYSAFAGVVSSSNTSAPSAAKMDRLRAILDEMWCDTVNGLPSKRTRSVETIKDLEILDAGFKNILLEAGLDISLTKQNSKLLLSAMSALDECPAISLVLRGDRLLDPIEMAYFTRRKSDIAQASDNLPEIPEAIDWSNLPPADEIAEHVSNFESRGLFGFLKPSVKAARNYWRNLSSDSSNTHSDETILKDLKTTYQWAKISDEFNTDDRLKAICGAAYDGISTNFVNVEAAAKLMEFSSTIIGSDIDAASQIRNMVRTSSADVVSRLISHFDNSVRPLSSSIENIRGIRTIEDSVFDLKHLKETADEGLRIVETEKINPRVSRAQLTEYIKRFKGFESATVVLDKNSQTVAQLQESQIPIHNADEILQLITTIHQIEETETEAWTGIRAALIGSTPQNYLRLQTDASSAKQRLDEYFDSVYSLATIGGAVGEGSNPITWSTLPEAEAKIDTALKAIPSLAQWLRLAGARRRATRPETAAIWDQRKSLPEESTMAEIWELIYWRSAVDATISQTPALRDETGITLQRARKRLGEIDEETRQLTRAIIASEVERKTTPAGVDSGSVKNKTELGLINHVKDQTKPTVSVRDFVHRAGRAAQSLKPCWMMSPASVARYLPRGSNLFDVVIMDEASQIRAEEATGTLARGKQVVIVGDQKQLPPTGFFRPASSSSDSEWVEEKTESILEKANQRFPHKRSLLWHYRSRHQDLIKFSNQFFYKNQLIVFPSATDSAADGMGVFFEHTPDALYQPRSSRRGSGGLNPEQGRIVAEKAIKAMIDRPEWSLGVAAVNRAQAEHIENEISRLTQTFSKARKYISDREGTLEPFFVKNLENVQGDERDHIIISTVYGPTTPGGRTLARFGPIGGEYGHRRLNVLFTRARCRVDVVSSMAANDILTSESSSEGVKALKSYLGFAATGQLEGTSVVPRGVPDSDFEISVGEALSDAGFEIHFQVGVAGYRIDIGLRDEAYPHGYLLGIECDGAMYHSARSARDRDILRQGVLEDLGWKIYRIWSTDWFENPTGELKKLMEYIDELKRTLVADTKQLSVPELDSLIDEALPDSTMNLDSSVDDLPDVPDSRLMQNEFENVAQTSPDIPTQIIPPSAGLETIDFAADWVSMPNEFADWSILPNEKQWEGVVDVFTFEHHPDDENDGDLMEVLEAQVLMFGPAHPSFISTQIQRTYKSQKFTTHTEHRLSRLLGDLVSIGAIDEADGFFDVPNQLLWGPDRPPRKALGRSIRQISFAELMAACTQIAAVQGISDTETLLKSVSKLLGYKRIGAVINERLGGVAGRCIARIEHEKQSQRLQGHSSPLIAENPLVQQGYDPTSSANDRWMFFVSISIPSLTKEGVINTLRALTNNLESDPGISKTTIGNMITDLSRLGGTSNE